MADALGIDVRIVVAGDEPSPRLRAALEELADALAEEAGDDVSGFDAHRGRLAIGPAIPVPQVPAGGDLTRKGPADTSWTCIGNWINDDGSGYCAIQWD